MYYKCIFHVGLSRINLSCKNNNTVSYNILEKNISVYFQIILYHFHYKIVNKNFNDILRCLCSVHVYLNTNKIFSVWDVTILLSCTTYVTGSCLKAKYITYPISKFFSYKKSKNLKWSFEPEGSSHNKNFFQSSREPSLEKKKQNVMCCLSFQIL